MKRKRDDVIELVPRSPFRWKVVISLIGIWLTVLILAIYTKHGLLRLLLPLIVFTIVAYGIYCAVAIIRRR